MSHPMVLVGYGSLMSKVGLVREGSVPAVTSVYGIGLQAQRGLAQTFREGRKRVMDLRLDDHEALWLRPLDGFLDGIATRGAPPAARPEHSLEAVALVTDARAWAWFSAREEFPPGLAEAIEADAAAARMPIGQWLGGLMEAGGPTGYFAALAARYGSRLAPASQQALGSAYLPVPVRLPKTDTTGRPAPAHWAITCGTAGVRDVAVSAKQAAADPRTDHDELRRYLVDCLAASVHGIDVADLDDEGQFADDPHWEALVDAVFAAERRPVDAIHRADDGAPGGHRHGMRPLVDLMPFPAAQRRFAEAARVVTGTDTIATEQAHGRVLAVDVRARVAVPMERKAAMDGYAVRAEDTYGALPGAARRLRRTAVRPAGPLQPGDDGVVVELGTCVQIATGAVLPAGADAVVAVEDTGSVGDQVDVRCPVAPGRHVIPAGSDLQRDAPVLSKGTVLDAARIAALAAAGVQAVTVHRRPRAVVLSSGDEVAPLGARLKPGQVYDSNGPALSALLSRWGCDVEHRAGVADDEAALEAAVLSAVADADIVVFTGGTSAGARDLLPGLLARLGLVHLHGIRMRPGKPVVLADMRGVPVVGLPGYPTSCLVTAHVLLRPLVRAAGGARVDARRQHVRLGAPIEAKRGWHTFVPVRVDAAGAAWDVFRGSSAVTSLSEADALIELAADQAILPAGSIQAALPLE